ncbi:DUF2937 family protein [Sulfitobacter sabulilitoris]|uniref:DUF2937 family protein n=1 Tax=Sulfitobacter sabulilitoris TaxID=2562655 RepID=A0A5S3Q393_9RHOB|nr:DUF2937 family protein [Sulfitobacter sabulilitoris]TMM50899.1 DUF2937 family protein [Sulfitobacter sabulilitoris]
MILRLLVLAGGLTGAAGLSQFPEYAQQYVQRLGGAVDELSRVVADFDASAAALDLSRAAALEQMAGTAFVERRRADMQATFARHARLRADLAVLERHGPFMRAYHGARLRDREIAARAWSAYQPALPLNFAGAVFGGIGALAGMSAVMIGAAPLRRRRRRA